MPRTKLWPRRSTLASGAVYLILYGTGIGTASVTATIGGVNATVQYLGRRALMPASTK